MSASTLSCDLFEIIETETNRLLDQACQQLMSDEGKVAHFSALFDRSSETGFYKGEGAPRGEGEKPGWAPNPAYMDSLEELWEPVDELLGERGLKLEKTLRELFYESREYKDQESDHRRVFHGQLVDAERNIPVTCFMLNIPHSHRGFNYLVPPQIQIAPLLKT